MTMTEVDEDPPPPHVRASGSTPAEEEAHEIARHLDDDYVPEPLDVEEEHHVPRFTRMRFNWSSPEEMQTIRNANTAVELQIVREFHDAYSIMAEIQEIVRTHVLGPEGEPVFEGTTPQWVRTPTGRIIEDYTKLTRKQQESFLGQITTRLFAWEQSAEKMWMEAMMAKAAFEERFSISYDLLRGTPARTTVDDRNQHASMEASDERYYAIYMTSVSRRAQALVRSMERLGQRMKDVMLAQ